ncbi:hypothetical protein TUBRATIS_28800 [Tubulinosema ratisbonensis]|uniref:Uncharacterized protein n=1 Tax=Tubulinosema ratisbonensis TaxID=291195 RepID=A0A437AHY5_9MICR|nr:hypothetical protein TUBRATIS_28800 [Tubulinosema ratisbonensis]
MILNFLTIIFCSKRLCDNKKETLTKRIKYDHSNFLGNSEQNASTIDLMLLDEIPDINKGFLDNQPSKINSQPNVNYDAPHNSQYLPSIECLVNNKDNPLVECFNEFNTPVSKNESEPANNFISIIIQSNLLTESNIVIEKGSSEFTGQSIEQDKCISKDARIDRNNIIDLETIGLSREDLPCNYGLDETNSLQQPQNQTFVNFPGFSSLIENLEQLPLNFLKDKISNTFTSYNEKAKYPCLDLLLYEKIDIAKECNYLESDLSIRFSKIYLFSLKLQFPAFDFEQDIINDNDRIEKLVGFLDILIFNKTLKQALLINNDELKLHRNEINEDSNDKLLHNIIENFNKNMRIYVCEMEKCFSRCFSSYFVELSSEFYVLMKFLSEIDFLIM